MRPFRTNLGHLPAVLSAWRLYSLCHLTHHSFSRIDQPQIGCAEQTGNCWTLTERLNGFSKAQLVLESSSHVRQTPSLCRYLVEAMSSNQQGRTKLREWRLNTKSSAMRLRQARSIVSRRNAQGACPDFLLGRISAYRKTRFMDPPATPGKAPSIALVLCTSSVPGSHQAPRCMSLQGWQRALRSRTRPSPLGIRDMQMARGPLCRRGLSNVEKAGV